MAKRLPEPYEPTAPPVRFEDWHRWIDWELHRIRDAIAADPVILAVSGQGNINISPVLNTVVLGEGQTPVLDMPGGSYNQVTGEWTCALAGIYSCNANVTIDPFGSGNKSYFGRIELIEVSPDPQIRASNQDGGLDDVPLGISLARPLAMNTGDVLQFELSAVHEQFTGDVDYYYSFSFVRTATLPG